jgi:hypothetical protein
MIHNRFCLLFFLAILQLSCTKVIDLKFKDSATTVVIEGSVVDYTDRQIVKISKSIPFTDPNFFPAVTGASVTITDMEGNRKILLEQHPGIYVTTDLQGEANKTYVLEVKVGDEIYSAESTMPEPVLLDSIDVVVSDILGKKYNTVEVYYQDPPGIPNFYRFKLKINGVLSSSIFVFQDEFNDGKSIRRELRDFDRDMLAEDDIELVMQSIDKTMYKYWSALSQNSGVQSSATPANPPSNISNGALGYFSAHTIQVRKFTIR